MLQLGRYNKLKVVNKLNDAFILEHGVKMFFREALEQEINIDDELDVFVYNDVEKGLIATLRTVYGQVDELALLRVVDTGPMGAFLDLGLEKDVLLLKNKMESEVDVDDEILVALRLDNKNRISATMRISDYLEEKPGSKVGDTERGIIYRVNEDMGIFIAIDGRYHGFIHKNKLTRDYKIGEEIEAKVIKVREDGKLELGFKDVAHIAMEGDSKIIYDYIVAKGGRLDVSDKSDPELIKRKIGLSKKAFKRALGKLYKEGKVEKIGDKFKLKK